MSYLYSETFPAKNTKGNHCFNYEVTVKPLIHNTAGYFSQIVIFSSDASEIRAFVAEESKLATELNWPSNF